MDVCVLSTLQGCVALPEMNHRELGASRDWTSIKYLIRGAKSADAAAQLVHGSCILHSVLDLSANRFELDAAELGSGKIVWAGMTRAV
ncbi:MAG: hypothetical protein WC565_08700 [Parcubacteria group bacterium]